MSGLSRRALLEAAGALFVNFSLAPLASAQGGPSPAAPSPRQLDSWLAVGTNGRVTAYSGKEELGQGIFTAQTQLVAEELSRFGSYVAKIDEAATLADDIEQIAVLAGGGIGPFAGDAFAGRVTSQAHEHRAAGGVPDIADLPVISNPPPVGEIVTAHRLGFPRQTMGQLCCIAGHVTPPPDRRCVRADSAPALCRGWPARKHLLARTCAASTR